MKDIYYYRPWRVWFGLVLDAEGNQVGDCEHFSTKALAKDWQNAV